LRNIDGYHVGLIAAYPLSKKLDLTAGLSYRSTKAYGDSLTYTRFEANGISSTPTTTNINVVKGKTLILNKLQYIEMPLNLHFNLNKKWSVFGGVKVGYLINEQVQYQGDTTVFVVLTADKKAQADQAFSGTPSAKTLRLNKWATALTGGFRYRFNPRISATLRYDFDLNSISQSANNRFNNRYLGLDLSYYFK
jgi:long-subunit fatty acid transport protein